MNYTTINEIFKKPDDSLDKTVTVAGWVRTVRSSNTVGFISLNDGTVFNNLQVVFEAGIKNYEALTKIPVGSAITAKGRVTASPGSGQPFELKAAAVEIISPADADYPLQKKRHSFEFLRTIAHLRGRSNTFAGVFRLRSKLDFALHRFLQERNFVYIHTPVITTSDCEGAGEMFTVTTLDPNKPDRNEKGEIDYGADFFGRKAGLTVSGQLNAEAMCHAFRNVYTFGPTFRAENSNTARHAAEFWMLEPEMAWADINDNMDLAEAMVKDVIKAARRECPAEMEFFNRFIDKDLLNRLDAIASSDFKRITYTEAIAILLKAGQKFDYPVKWGIDLQTEHERYLAETEFKRPVFVIDYPKEIKAFYMRLNDDGRTVAAMDLLVPGVGEIIGGSQREERLEVLQQRMVAAGLDPKDYWWYLDLRRFGGVIHSGFGLGFERLVMYLSGMTNIRDVSLFPRVPKSADF
ncbi:MAG: asparagine--tRNA ligase [Planctomycetes bacterium]|nr:asparagine--tRNA ligase [Planctomycetota bacterium]